MKMEVSVFSEMLHSLLYYAVTSQRVAVFMLIANPRMEHVPEHWGEMHESQNIRAEAIPAELRNLLILKAMKPDPFNLHQPCKQEDNWFE
jgi:hypothetical protein